MESIDEEAVQILTNNLLGFMKVKTDHKIFHQFCAYLFSELTELFPTEMVISDYLGSYVKSSCFF